MGERLGLAVWDGKEKAFFYSHWGGERLSFVSIVAEGIIFGKAKDTKSFVEAMKPLHNEIRPIERLYGADIEYFGVVDFACGIAAKTGLMDYDVRDEFAKRLEVAPSFATWDLLLSKYRDFEYMPMVVLDLEPIAITQKFGEIVLDKIGRIELEFGKRLPPMYPELICNWLGYYTKLVRISGEPPIHEKVIEKASKLLSRGMRGDL